MDSFYGTNDPRRFIVLFGILNGMTILSLAALVYHWHYHPPPEAGSVILEKSKNGSLKLKIKDVLGWYECFMGSDVCVMSFVRTYVVVLLYEEVFVVCNFIIL